MSVSPFVRLDVGKLNIFKSIPESTLDNGSTHYNYMFSLKAYCCQGLSKVHLLKYIIIVYQKTYLVFVVLEEH